MNTEAPPHQTPTVPPGAVAPVVACEGVSVSYGSHCALNNVSLAFPAGAVGLLGPNGAGKSSLIKAVLGLVTPAAGRMTVLGRDVAADPMGVRARIGYMPEHDAHIPGMTAVRFVAYCGELAGLPRTSAMQRAHEVLFYVGLGEARYRSVDTYSTGMKQRIKLAQALVHDPDLLLLDEPTNGLDPRGRDDMLGLIADLAHRKGVNLVLSSHLLPDVEATCRHVVVMHQGAVAAAGPMATLLDQQGHLYELRIKGDGAAFAAALRAAGVECHDTEETTWRVTVPRSVAGADDASADGPDAGVQWLCAVAVREGVQVRHVRASMHSLEDVFARVVGGER
ncbi:MAG: ABC transporter ATP-binding protein [Acidobacteria bacterium]|nr:ABC transporter ATP-binding protein [Acidobacteriota bacterium]